LQAHAGLGKLDGNIEEAGMTTFQRSAAIASFLALAACASHGVEPRTAAQFKPGVTTRAEVIKRLGPPASVYDGMDETRTLTWARSGGLFDGGSTKGLSIQFGPDDKMVRVVSQP
jgi:hypothetical protein